MTKDHCCLYSRTCRCHIESSAEHYRNIFLQKILFSNSKILLNQLITVPHHRASLSAPDLGHQRDKPIISYVGDTAVMMCKLEESKPEPSNWTWYKHTEEVREQLLLVAIIKIFFFFTELLFIYLYFYLYSSH